jgi:hypothetical protein
MKFEWKRIPTALGLLLGVFLNNAGAQVATSANQATADSVAANLRAHQGLASSRIMIEAKNGIVTLSGVVSHPSLKAAAVTKAGQAYGVKGVVDRLAVGDTRVQQAQYNPGQPSRVALGGHGHSGSPIVSGPVGGGEVIYGNGSGNVGGYAGGAGFGQDMSGPLPEGASVPGGTQASNPGAPNYAWPSYAPHPNFSAVGYPTVYPWQAFPNIGPFYPYPEVPLDWRAVTLRWDDGLWWLDFRKHYTRPFFTPYPFGIFGY